MNKIKPIHIIVLSANAAAVAAALILTAVGSSLAESQNYNLAYERWKGSSSYDFSQISCFFSDNAGFSVNNVNSARSLLVSALTDASYDTANNTPFVDAYSCYVANAPVKCDISGKSNADITAVGGDFFFFHDFELVDGSYFSDNDTMQDGAVIDRELAWFLYGSDDVSGMNIYINGIRCYIAGVIKNPDTKADRLCASKAPKAYISYETASAMQLSNSDSKDSSFASDFTRISNYECIIPEPVKNFGLTTMKKIIGNEYGDNVSVINNSERFSPKKRCKALKNIEKSVIRSDSVRLPAWENASRITEFKLSYIYTARKYLLFLPALTILFLLVKLFCLWQKNKNTYKKAVFERLRSKLTRTKKPATERINLQ